MKSENEEFHSDEEEENPDNLNEKEFTLYLISLYRRSPSLWDIKSQEYRDKHKKALELGNIKKLVNKYRPMDEIDIKKKINCLRTNFRREHNKVIVSTKSGLGSEVYKPSLYYYDELKFLSELNEAGQTESSFMEESDISSNSSSPSSSASTAPHRRKRTVNDELMSLAYEHFKKPLMDSEIISRAWAVKLDRMTPDQRRHAEKFIGDVLYEGECGNLSRSCEFIVPTAVVPSPKLEPQPLDVELPAADRFINYHYQSVASPLHAREEYIAEERLHPSSFRRKHRPAQ